MYNDQQTDILKGETIQILTRSLGVLSWSALLSTDLSEPYAALFHSNLSR